MILIRLQKNDLKDIMDPDLHAKKDRDRIQLNYHGGVLRWLLTWPIVFMVFFNCL